MPGGSERSGPPPLPPPGPFPPGPLPPGPPLKLPVDVDAYMAGQRSAALLIVHDGKIRLERYGLGFDNSGRWTSFSSSTPGMMPW